MDSGPVRLQWPLSSTEEPHRVLLHTCCAPCSSAVVEALLAGGICPTIFYFNPNIYPEEEYLHRKAESLRYAGEKHIPFVDADRDHEAWRSGALPFQNEPERGARCLYCFKYRLLETARYAVANGFTLFATTLSSSRWKNLDQINEAGRYAAEAVNTPETPTLHFWEANWRKGGLQARRDDLIKIYGFYNQTYCGCEFSI